MRFRPCDLVVVGVALSFSLSCASRREGPLPTLEDYSDGVSAYAEDFLAGWRTAAPEQRLYTAGFVWSGPLPGDELTPVPSRLPLSLAIYRSSEHPSAPAPRLDSAAFGRRLEEIRARFSSLGRSENTLFGFVRRGEKRDVVFGLLLTGRGLSGELRQEGGKIRATLCRVGPSPRSWQMESAHLIQWLAASASEPQFEETAAKSGLGRTHHAFLPNAARNVPIPGEHMPPGAAVIDYDGDGREDLFVAGGDGNHLYRNRGDGTYEDVTQRAGVGGQEGEAVGALAFDYDNDGKTDLYVTYLYRPNLLYHNRGDGTFEEVGQRAGVALNDYCTSAAAIDYNRDGRPDLYVLVYGPPDRGPNIRANNAPPNHLFRNNGDGSFTDVSKESRADDTGWGLAVQSADLDGDGWPDLYIANDFGNHTYLHNNGDGTFRNLASRARILDPGFGMGVAIDDYDGDGRLDLYVSNYSFPLNWFLSDPRYPMPEFPYSLGRPLVWRRLKLLSRGSSLFRPAAEGRFERTSDEAEVWDTSWSWGCVWIDADLDGRPDLFVVNGMVTGKNPLEHEIDFWNLMSAEYKKFEKGIPTGDFGEDSLWGHPPKRFYKNLDGRHFAELAAVTGLESDANQRGLVVTDANGDGAPDLFATGFLQPPSLWINRNPSRARSLVVTVEGNANAPGPYRSTREGLGAVVTVEVGGGKRAQVVSAGYSFLSSGSKSLYFGLGDHERADRVFVRWPSGGTTERRSVPAGRLHLTEARGPTPWRAPTAQARSRGRWSGRPGDRDRLTLTAASEMQERTRDRWLARVALGLAALAATTPGCGPRVVVARIVTPTPASGETSPAAPPAPPPRRAAASPTPTPSPTSIAARPLAPASTTPTPFSPPAAVTSPIPGPRQKAAATTPPSGGATPTPTRVATLTPPPSATSSPIPSPSATLAPARIPTATSPPTVTSSPIPSPSATVAPPPIATASPVPRPSATLAPARIPTATPPPTATSSPIPRPSATLAPARIATAAPPPPATASPIPRPSATVPQTRTAATPTRAGPRPESIPATAAPPFTPTSAAAVPGAASASPLLGSWAFRAETGDRPIGGDLRFSLEGSEVVGFYVGPSGKATRLISLLVSGNQIAFDIVGPLGKWHLVGTVAGDRMSGTFETITRTIPWIAAKKPATTPSAARTPSPPPAIH